LGPCRLHLIPQANAPLADFPVWRVIGTHHFLADLTLPYGRVVHDYNKEADDLAEAAKWRRRHASVTNLLSYYWIGILEPCWG
jgi:hypothetical protein